MSRLGELIRTLCPDGVEYKRLGDCLDYEQPSKYIVHSNEYEDKGLPVLTAGQTFILGYTSETDGIFEASKDNPVIIFDDFTTSFHWVDFNFKVKSSAMKMLRPSYTNISFRFVYYAMKCIKYETLEHSRQWISKYSDIEIPVPPMEVQEELVRLLDKYTEVVTELESRLAAELEARKKQYEHYRDTLLEFTPVDEKIAYRTMGEIGTFIRGNGLQKRDFTESGVPCIHYGQIYTHYGTFAYQTKSFVSDGDAKKLKKAQSGDLIITTTSENIEDVCKCVAWLGKGVVCIGGHSCAFSHNENPKYVAYFLQTSDFFTQKQKYARGIKVIDIKISDLEKIVIPIPPIEEQERIVGFLDKFEAICTDLCEGLPAEIEARRRQYEHYRDRLLTFRRKSA